MARLVTPSLAWLRKEYSCEFFPHPVINHPLSVAEQQEMVLWIFLRQCVELKLNLDKHLRQNLTVSRQQQRPGIYEILFIANFGNLMPLFCRTNQAYDKCPPSRTEDSYW